MIILAMSDQHEFTTVLFVKLEHVYKLRIVHWLDAIDRHYVNSSILQPK